MPIKRDARKEDKLSSPRGQEQELELCRNPPTHGWRFRAYAILDMLLLMTAFHTVGDAISHYGNKKSDIYTHCQLLAPRSQAIERLLNAR